MPVFFFSFDYSHLFFIFFIKWNEKSNVCTFFVPIYDRLDPVYVVLNPSVVVHRRCTWQGNENVWNYTICFLIFTDQWATRVSLETQRHKALISSGTMTSGIKNEIMYQNQTLAGPASPSEQYDLDFVQFSLSMSVTLTSMRVTDK